MTEVKKRKRLFEKGLKKIAKLQNLSQNELNQIAEMRGQSRNEFEQITKIRAIKKKYIKKDLIKNLLNSRQIIDEFFNKNLDDDKISDIRRILNRPRDTLP